LKETGKKKISFTLLGDDDDTAKKAAEFVQSQLENNLGTTLIVYHGHGSNAISINQLNICAEAT
jgi:hypothetical protein